MTLARIEIATGYSILIHSYSLGKREPCKLVVVVVVSIFQLRRLLRLVNSILATISNGTKDRRASFGRCRRGSICFCFHTCSCCVCCLRFSQRPWRYKSRLSQSCRL